MMIIDLSWGEVENAWQIGAARSCAAWSHGWRATTLGADHDPLPAYWGAHPLGAIVECAVARWTGHYWQGADYLRRPDGGEPDVGPYYVRATEWRGSGLAIRPSDPDDGIFVSGFTRESELPRVTIRGWLRAADGKRRTYGKHPRRGQYAWYSIPTHDLHSPETLPEFEIIR